MPSDRWRKKMFTNKGTGTVPKVTYRNNGTPNRSIQPDVQNQHHLSNNLDLSWQRQTFSNSSRNLGRAAYDLNPYAMDTSVMEDRRQNDLVHLNMPGRANEALSTSSSSVSNSRRDSLGTIPKCDNVKKYPDKKQIEDQLNQIREYLRVTTSLMSSIKNNDDQHAIKEREQFKKMINDLKDSEAKLLVLVNDPLYDNSDPLENDGEHLENGVDNLSECNAAAYQRNELEEKVDFTNRKVQLLREQQSALLNLKRKAENQLSEVRHLTDENRLLSQQPANPNTGNQLRSTKGDQGHTHSDPPVQMNIKNYNENGFEPTIKDLEDRISEMRNDLRHHAANGQENGMDHGFLHERLESSNQLLHLLENRDGQLTSEHSELQEKLSELQIKKTQIDQLAQQLQNLGDDEDEDIGHQVRKIVTMKQQLSSLKDLLEVVKNTEFSLLNIQNVNEQEPDSQSNGHGVCTKTDNIRQNVRVNHNENAGCNSRANEQWFNEKDSNKPLIGIQEREKVLAELRAKKRELEEIMYKQKDRASINNDVCSEISVNKSEASTNNNMFDGSVMSWLPVHPHHNQIASAYSSDDCLEEDANEFSDLNSAISVTLGNLAHSQSAAPSLNSNVNMRKCKTDTSSRVQRSLPSDFIRHSSSLTPEHRATSVSTSVSAIEQEIPSTTNSTNGLDRNKVQVQKQLELIQQVCQSLLEQQTSGSVQQLQNNLSPLPLYSDPRLSVPPSQQQVSALNYINPSVEMPYANFQPMNPQFFGLNDVANNQNLLTANTLQTQAFLLNTVNQCCQMLWFQQREITSLRNLICSIQDQMGNRQSDPEISEIPSINPYIFQSQPSMFRAPSQPRNTPPKANQVSSACSMPNLNPPSPHANLDGNYISHNNIRSSPSARLLDSSLNNLSNQNLMGEQPANNTVLPNVNVANTSLNSLPTQIWNGQALNNQVAPGNRANNYWDNFRSYSRQNLLSTSSKSNEGLQTSATGERSNITYDRSHSFSLPPVTPPKLNTVHNEATNVSGENTPRRQLHFKTSQNSNNANKSVPAPPDVLNINHHSSHQNISGTLETSNAVLVDLSSTSGETVNVKDLPAERTRNRNEWHNGEQSNSIPKSKLFEELRDNVYKEVANLISANENRPHFLIQLFRDLQHINSDSMRGRTLQSIQTVLTHSLIPLEVKRGPNRQSPSVGDQAASEQEVSVNSEHYAVQPSLRPPQSAAVAPLSRESTNRVDIEDEDPNINNILKPIIVFLTTHKDAIFHQELLDLFKGLLMKSIPFSEIFANRNAQEQTFLIHFSIILNEAFEKYKAKRVCEVYKDILKTVSDILVGELSFIYLFHENVPENVCEIMSNNPPSHENLKLHLNHQNKQVDDVHTPQMQNGDLAEADQTRMEPEQQEVEEGAVGGILNGIVDVVSSNTTDQIRPDLTDLPKLDFSLNSEIEVEFMEQGLDQVPTRLTTTPRSHSTTPNRDRSRSRTDTLDHF